MASFSWTVVPGPTVTPTAGDEVSRLFGKDFLFDTDLQVGANGDYVLIEGVEALKQAIYHRLITRPGEFKLRPTYGVGIVSFVKRRNRATELRELEQKIIDQLSLESRIEDVIAVEVANIDNGISIAIRIRVAGQELTFLPLNLTDDVTGVPLEP